jgi:molecular chaperone GrpE
MSPRRLIWQEISRLATRVAHQGSVDGADLDQIVQQLGRLGRDQFKADALFEAEQAQQEEMLSALRATITRQEQMLATLGQNQQRETEAAHHHLLLSLLPVIDGLEAALTNGARQVVHSSAGGDPRSVLIAWLDGLRVVHRRMLDVLAQAGMEPIQAVGQPFDPGLHVAVGVDASGRAPTGMVVTEQRRGYRASGGVLRFAEVVVSRPADSFPPRPRQPQPAAGPEPSKQEGQA